MNLLLSSGVVELNDSTHEEHDQDGSDDDDPAHGDQGAHPEADAEATVAKHKGGNTDHW